MIELLKKLEQECKNIESINNMASLIEIKNLYKIFGKHSQDALLKVKKGMGKDELLEKTGCVLGLNNINLSIPKVI